MNIHINLSDSARSELVDEGFDKNFGARPLKRVVSRVLESNLAKKIIAGELKENDQILLDYKDGQFLLTHTK